MAARALTAELRMSEENSRERPRNFPLTTREKLRGLEICRRIEDAFRRVYKLKFSRANLTQKEVITDV